MSESYRLMTYFVVTTIFFYSKTIEITPDESVDSFRKKNPEIIKRVFDEGLNIFKYELSDNQISTGIAAYISTSKSPQSVFDSVAYGS